MTDYAGTRLDTELFELMLHEIEKLRDLHPYTEPGLWDSCVDNIRAIRSTIYAQQSRVMDGRIKSIATVSN